MTCFTGLLPISNDIFLHSIYQTMTIPAFQNAKLASDVIINFIIQNKKNGVHYENFVK